MHVNAVRTVALPCLVVVALAGCGRGAAVQSPAPVGLFSIEERVLRGNEGGIREATQQVIRTPDQLNTIWQQATSTQRTPIPLPQVDFERKMLLLVSGGRMWDEDEVRVDSVSERRIPIDGREQQALLVYYTIAEGCRRNSQNSYPIEIVRVSRYSGPVRFIPEPKPPQNCR